MNFLQSIFFCYNRQVKIKFITQLSLLLLLVLPLIPEITGEEQSIGEFIAQIQKSLELKNIPAYLENFSDEIRIKEESGINDMFGLFQMDSVALFKASKLIRMEDQARIYLQVLFENSYSVVIETWDLDLLNINGQWQIKKKKIIGSISPLYKLKIPSERVERVHSIEVENVDIKLSFRNATIFYDNIPRLETAILIVGKGHLSFSPSDPVERHQLALVYKRSYVEDELTYAFLRFSNHFFQNNIKVMKEPHKESYEVSQAERNEAYSLFSKHYSRSFTIENSLNKELLSTLPQGDETVFSFNGKKLGDFTYIYSPFTEEEINFFRWKDKKIINLYSPIKDEKKRRLFISFAQMFDVKNYQIDIDFKPRQSYLSGKAKVEVESKVDSLVRLKLKLNPKLEIIRIYDEERRELFYSQDKLRETLYVYFVQPPPKRKPFFIEIYYRGKLEPPKQVADVVAGPQAYKLGQYREKIDFLPMKFETYLFSRSAYWYPSPPDNDYFKASLRIIVPPEYQCVSNGELIKQTRLNDVERVEEIEKTGSSVYVFETKYPLKYLSFIVGRLTKLEEDSKFLLFQHFYSFGVNFEKKGLLEEVRNIVQFYESKFGPYPYEKLSIVRRLWLTSGGHSPASFIVINELPQAPNGMLLVNVRSPVDFSRWKEYYLAHEIAHQWWGQSVTWKTYHDQWLSEGLAQFAAILYLRERHAEGVFSPIFKKLSQWTEKKSKWGPITLGSRLSYFDSKAYQSIIYNKTSLVLNMLKDLLGEEVFFQGLKEFFSRHKYSAASTNDYIKTIEEVSGEDLTAFFETWFDSYVLPEVRVSHTLLKEEKRYILRLKINQLKKVFVFPLWIEWIENGKKVRKKVIIDERDEEFDFELRKKPRKIKINPDKVVPGRFF